MEKKNQAIFRQKTLDRISAPEQLTDYLRVTTPGIWIMFVAVILILAGVFSWAAVGTLKTEAAVKVIVENDAAQVLPMESQTLSEGMPLRVGGEQFVLNAVESDEYGRSVGTAGVTLPDGTYDGTVVTETVRPIEFLLTSR